MEQSSYLVKPELFVKNEKVDLTFIEEVLATECHNGIILKTNTGDFVIELYEPGIIRFVTYNRKFDLVKSFSINDIPKVNGYKVEKNGDKLNIISSNLIIEIYYKPFLLTVYKDGLLKYRQIAIGFNDVSTFLFFERTNNDLIYGLGEKTGYLNKNNEKTINWNKDVFEPHTRSNKELYQSINMFSHKRETYEYGMFIDNPSRVTFDFLSSVSDGIVYTDIGKLDYYLFTGDNLKAIVSSYGTLAGRTFLPPIWALGYHQSRHSYESKAKLLEIVSNFEKYDIPVDAIYLDIMYMDEYRVFTFNDKTFNEIGSTIKALKEKGIRIVPIVDPGLKVEKGYKYYDEGFEKDLLCKYPDGSIFTGDVWPGKSAFYDFTNSKIREEWGINHSFYTDLGIEGIWNDMNEPSVFHVKDNTMDLSVLHNMDGLVMTHREAHNLYGLGMSMATYNGLKELINKRPFVLTRAGYAGIQKYSFVWTGDNRSSWEHLEMTMPMCLNLNMSGVTLCGPDIGGFMDDVTEEMLIRWVEMGVFLPFFRNHCSINQREQEPWQFSENALKIMRKFIRLRYELIYYIYSEVYKSHHSGIPVMRPLVLEYEDDVLTHNIYDEFLIGSNILVAPIYRPGEIYRKVYLPKGNWYNFFTNEKYEGKRNILVKAEVDEIPVFIKAGSVIPLTEAAKNTDNLSKNITINVYTTDIEFTDYFIVDDGRNIDGKYSTVVVNTEQGKVLVSDDGQFNYKYEINKIK